MTRIRDFLAGLRPESDRERTFLAGLVLLGVGLYFAWPPAALIVPGGILLVLGLLSSEAPE